MGNEGYIFLLVLAAIGILFAVIAIVKRKRKSDEAAALMKRMEAHAKRRNALFEGQRPEDSDYGYSLTNPIMTSTISCSTEYLSNLRTPDGESFTWSRLGAYCVKEISGIEGVMVDKYQLYLNEKEYKVIYICPYGHNGSFVPEGLKLED